MKKALMVDALGDDEAEATEPEEDSDGDLNTEPWDPREMTLDDIIALENNEGKEVEYQFLEWVDIEGRHFLQCVEVLDDDADLDVETSIELHVIEWDFDADGIPEFEVVEETIKKLFVLEYFEAKGLKKQVLSRSCTVQATGAVDTYLLTETDKNETYTALLVTPCMNIKGHNLVVFNVVVPQEDGEELVPQYVFRYQEGNTSRYEALDEETRAEVAVGVAELIETWSDKVIENTQPKIAVGEG